MIINDCIVLVRTALTGERADIKITPELYDMVARNGVTALTWNVAETQHPPREIALKWALSAERIEARYERQLSAAQHLAEFYRSNGIRMLILKGIGLSRYYPHPSTRECGDIDIYLFGDYKKGNDLVNIETRYNIKHSSFDFEGIHIENHRVFMRRHKTSSYNRLTDDNLYQLLDKYGAVEMGDFLFPSPQFNILFTLRHAVNHFSGDIPLRQAVDWALLLRSERSNIDWTEMCQIISYNKLERFFDAITIVAAQLTGEDFTPLMFNPNRAKQDAEILFDIFEKIKSHPVAKSMLAKLFRTVSKYRRYRLMPDSFCGVLWRKIRDYIINRL